VASSKPPPGCSAVEPDEAKPYAVSASSEGPPTKLPSTTDAGSLQFEDELAAPRILPPFPLPLLTGYTAFPSILKRRALATLAFGLFLVLALLRLLFFVYQYERGSEHPTT